MILDKIEIKKVTPADVEPLQTIGKRTFNEAFSNGNTEEDMQKYLDESFSIEKLTGELTDPNSEFYFAQIGNKVIGYLKINFGKAQTELKDEKSLEIERIYVLKEYYGKKVGQILFDKALQIAKQTKSDYLWLGVWEKNPRAIAFYRKNGFQEFDKHIFKLGNDEQTDILMKRKL
jgi:ribosomal protein S18 acetylase RimI-like enzyme